MGMLNRNQVGGWGPWRHCRMRMCARGCVRCQQDSSAYEHGVKHTNVPLCCCDWANLQCALHHTFEIRHTCEQFECTYGRVTQGLTLHRPATCR